MYIGQQYDTKYIGMANHNQNNRITYHKLNNFDITKLQRQTTIWFVISIMCGCSVIVLPLMPVCTFVNIFAVIMNIILWHKNRQIGTCTTKNKIGLICAIASTVAPALWLTAAYRFVISLPPK